MILKFGYYIYPKKIDIINLKCIMYHTILTSLEMEDMFLKSVHFPSINIK